MSFYVSSKRALGNIELPQAYTQIVKSKNSITMVPTYLGMAELLLDSSHEGWGTPNLECISNRFFVKTQLYNYPVPNQMCVALVS